MWLFEKYIQKIQYCLPTASVTAICLIVAAVVSHNSEKILSTGLIIFVIVIMHNLLGYLCGYLIGILFKMNMPRKKAVSIEIGLQNSGLATSLDCYVLDILDLKNYPPLRESDSEQALVDKLQEYLDLVFYRSIRYMQTGICYTCMTLQRSV